MTKFANLTIISNPYLQVKQTSILPTYSHFQDRVIGRIHSNKKGLSHEKPSSILVSLSMQISNYDYI